MLENFWNSNCWMDKKKKQTVIHKKQYTLNEYQKLPKWRMTKYVRRYLNIWRYYSSTVKWYKNNDKYQDINEEDER